MKSSIIMTVNQLFATGEHDIRKIKCCELSVQPSSRSAIPFVLGTLSLLNNPCFNPRTRVCVHRCVPVQERLTIQRLESINTT